MNNYDEYRSPVGKENGRHARPLVPRTGGPSAAILGLQRSAGNRATTAIVQRVLTRQDPGMIQDRNLADTILHASANATTPVVVNDIELPQQGLGAAAAAALNTPQINIVHQPQGGYTATVTQEPNNTLGANVKYPTDPPWRYHQADADRVERALGGRSDANKAKKRSQPWGVMTRRQGAFLFRARRRGRRRNLSPPDTRPRAPSRCGSLDRRPERSRSLGSSPPDIPTGWANISGSDPPGC